MTRDLLTYLVEHLVALIENEYLDAPQAQVLVPNQGVETARSGNDDVGMLVLVLQNLNVLLHGGAAVKDGRLDIGHVFAEPCVFILNLICELTRVTHHENRGLSRDRVDLLEGGEDEDGGLTETGFGLAEDIGTQNRLRDANLLD